jgi:hypothetical protein
LIFKISKTCFGQTFAHHQERNTANYSMWCGILTANPPQEDTIPHAVICNLTLLMMGKCLTETCFADFEDQ